MPRIKNYTLILIDLQSYFRASKNKTIRKNVIKEMHQAKRLGNHIMLVEYGGYGSTAKWVSTHLKKYANTSTVLKFEDDGSDVIINALKKRTHLRVCGVNTNYCVKATVDSLGERLPNFRVDVVKEACWDEY